MHTVEKAHKAMELHYILQGTGTLHLSDRSVPVSKGDCYFIDFDMPHRIGCACPADFSVLKLSFLPEFIDSSLTRVMDLSTLAGSYFLLPPYVFSPSSASFVLHDHTGEICRLFLKAETEYLKKPYGYLAAVRSCIIQILLLYIREKSTPTKDMLSDKIRQICAEMAENPEKPLFLADHAKKLHISPAQLSRRFQAVMHVSYLEFLQIKRMEKSCRLLEDTDKSISEIAALVGYKDIKSFHKAFKKYTGMTPREFRKTHLLS